MLLNFSFNSNLAINLRYEEYKVYIKIKHTKFYLLCTNNLSLISISRKFPYRET